MSYLCAKYKYYDQNNIFYSSNFFNLFLFFYKTWYCKNAKTILCEMVFQKFFEEIF